MEIKYLYDLPEKMPTNVNESSMSRIYGKLTDDSRLAIISAYRGNDRQLNSKKTSQLKTDVRNLGCGFNQMVSKWTENNETTDEESLIIYGITKQKALKLGEKYSQTSVIYKDGDGCREYLTTPRGEFEDGRVGDIIRTYDLGSDNMLNIESARDIFASRVTGPVSKRIKGSNQQPGKLRLNESFELFEKIQPRASYFHTAYSFVKII